MHLPDIIQCDVIMDGVPSQFYIIHYRCGARRCNNVVIMKATRQLAPCRLKSQAPGLFAQSFVRAHIKESINAPCHWLLWGESNCDRWPVTRKIFPFDDVIVMVVIDSLPGKLVSMRPLRTFRNVFHLHKQSYKRIYMFTLKTIVLWGPNWDICHMAVISNPYPQQKCQFP